MKIAIALTMLATLTAASGCSKKVSSTAPGPADLSQAVPGINTDGVDASVSPPPSGSQDAVAASPATVAGSCQTLDESGDVASCVDFAQPAYSAASAQTGCQQLNPSNRFAPGQACTHERSSGGCSSAENSTVTWFYLAQVEAPGSRPAPSCDSGESPSAP